MNFYASFLLEIIVDYVALQLTRPFCRPYPPPLPALGAPRNRLAAAQQVIRPLAYAGLVAIIPAPPYAAAGVACENERAAAVAQSSGTHNG